MVAKPLCPLYKYIIKPLDRAYYPELRYKMFIDDIDIIEPTLLFTKEKFLEVYPKYSNRNLPKRILGLYVVFVLKPIL